MSQPSSPSPSLKRANRNESRADKHKQRKAVTFKSSDTTVPGAYETPVPSISDTLAPGTLDTPVCSISDTSVPGISDTTVPDTSDAPAHEEPSRSSSPSPIIPPIIFPASLQHDNRDRSEFFSPPPESDTSCNMSKPATSQSTFGRQGNYARRGSPFIPQYTSRGPSRDKLNNTTALRDQSFYGALDSESDKSNSDEDDDSDKENEDPEAPLPNTAFKESEAHPSQHLQGTESEEPVGSSSTYWPFPPEYQPSRQEVYDKVNRFNGDNVPFDNRPPFSGPNMQSQQDSNGPLYDHAQERTKDSKGPESRNDLEKLVMGAMKALVAQIEWLQSGADTYRQIFSDESCGYKEKALYREEANTLEDRVYKNHMLLLSYLKALSEVFNSQN